MKHLMKRWYGAFVAFLLTTLAVISLTGCSSTTPITTSPATTSITTTTTTVTTSSSTTSPNIAASAVVTVINGSKTKSYSLTDLQALASVSGYCGQLGRGGAITQPNTYQGVALMTLLNAVGGITEGQNVTITASDNYAKTLSYDQITNIDFNYYDTSGNPITLETKPTLVLVYSMNGNALDNNAGPTELGLLSTQKVLTDASLWVRMVKTITVASAP